MKHDTCQGGSSRHLPRFNRIAAGTLMGLIAATLGSTPLRAEDPLPTGAQILDKYVEATGGKAAYARLKNRLTKAKMEMVAQGMSGTIETYNARPNLLHSTITLDALGTSEQGCDGIIVWENSGMTGPSIKEGAERALMMREASFDSDVNWRNHYKEAKCIGTETRDDEIVYKVILTPNEGLPETHYYSKESHLAVGAEMKLETAMGVIPVVVTVSDYRKVDGILIPHKSRQVLMGTMEVVTTSESIKHNVEVPADEFKPPAEVEALAKKQADQKAGKKKETP